ncbi:MAG: HAMP domain-containing histidine kinase, partial [Bacteroidetes bacterium]|nr:HAMP domain-containing histidine kinase [Bacteroidota bacterium]
MIDEKEIARLNNIIQQLEDEKQILKEENGAIENYMHTLVHDFKNPLGSISGFTGFLLEDEYSKEEKKEFIKIIIETVDHMFKMIDSYLLLNKFEKLGGQLVKKTKTVLELVDDIKKIFNRHYSPNQLHMSLKKPEDSSVDFELFEKKIEIDPDLFFSAVTNLVNNAIEASGKVSVNIFKKDNLFCLNISNQGEIPEKIQANLFKKFNTSKSKGT